MLKQIVNSIYLEESFVHTHFSPEVRLRRSDEAYGLVLWARFREPFGTSQLNHVI
jgi:hypothetical protein